MECNKRVTLCVHTSISCHWHKKLRVWRYLVFVWFPAFGLLCKPVEPRTLGSRKGDEHQEESREPLQGSEQTTHHEVWKLPSWFRERLWVLRLDRPLTSSLSTFSVRCQVWLNPVHSSLWSIDASSEYMSTMDTTDSEDSSRPAAQQTSGLGSSKLAMVGGSYSNLSPMIIMNNVLLKQVRCCCCTQLNLDAVTPHGAYSQPFNFRQRLGHKTGKFYCACV